MEEPDRRGADHRLMTPPKGPQQSRVQRPRSSWDSIRAALPISMWTAYFALAPVVWLPALGTATMAGIKGLLFAGAVWATWASVDRPRIPDGILGLLGAVALFLSASLGLFQAASAADVTTNLYSLALPFVVLWSFWNLPRLRGSLLSIAVPAGVFLAALSAIVIFADIAHPAALNGPLPQAARAAWVSGFNTQSTGWSHGVALYVPFLCVAAFSSRHRRAITSTAALILIISGQFVVFGRGGILIALISVLVVLAVRFRRYMNWLLVVAVLLLVPIAIMATDTPEPDPFARNEGIGFDQLDKFSSNRLDLLQQGAAMIVERPLTGHGFGNDWIITPVFELQIHVTWLRMAVQGGVVFPAVFLAIVLTITAQAVRTLRSVIRTDNPLPVLATILVLFGGIVASFIEPSAIVGAFHASSLWWAAAGVTTRLAYDTTLQHRRSRRRYWDPTADQG